jgi:uncharacterized phiE125 gp8 family phage protein
MAYPGYYFWDYCTEPFHAAVVAASKIEPEKEIFQLDEMKIALRLTTSDTRDDTYITGLISAARKHIELATGRSLVRRDYVMGLNRFPNLYWDKTDRINLWYPPLFDCDTIKYIDVDGAEQSLLSGRDFQVDFLGEPGRLAPLSGSCWPATKYRVMNAVRIEYTAGYEVDPTIEQPETSELTNIPAEAEVTTALVDRSIPVDLVNGVKQLVAHWYQNRQPVNAIPGAGGAYQILPMHVQEIVNDYVFETLTPTLTPEF